jgi:uncharacterized protein YbjT (DUF2867 family)
VIITGATGMVGEGVLHECLSHPSVSNILLVNRRPTGISHPKVTEVIHQNFLDISPIAAQLKGYNTCFFCLGISSINVSEKDYTAQTYTLTTAFARGLAAINEDMTFLYISGAGTDSTEKGRSMWARVKGRTENDLMKLPFKKVYNVRPGYLHPTKGLKNAHGFYRFIGFLYPFFKLVASRYVSSLKDLGLAMINAAANGYPKSILEVKDIHALAKGTQ